MSTAFKFVSSKLYKKWWPNLNVIQVKSGTRTSNVADITLTSPPAGYLDSDIHDTTFKIGHADRQKDRRTDTQTGAEVHTYLKKCTKENNRVNHATDEHTHTYIYIYSNGPKIIIMGRMGISFTSVATSWRGEACCLLSCFPTGTCVMCCT